MICHNCGREYDPSMEFIEEVELLEALNYFVNIEVLCPECLYKIRDKIEEMVCD